MKRTIYIAESDEGGHRLVYVRLLIEAAHARGLATRLGLTKRILATPEYLRHLWPVRELFSIDVLERWGFRELQSRARQLGAAQLIIPDGDIYSLPAAFAWHKPVPTTLLIMRDPRWTLESHRGVLLKQRAKLAILKLAQLRRGVDIVWLRNPGYRPKPGERYAIDPVILDGDEVEIAVAAERYREQIGMHSDIFWFGVVGVLSRRKNIPLIVDAMVQLAAEAQVGLALLGPRGNEVDWRTVDLQAKCLANGVAFVRDDRVLSNFEMNVAVKALDCVVMAYSSHSPNATLGKAARLGTRIVAAGPASIRRFVAGVASVQGVQLDATELLSAMKAALRSPQPAVRRELGPEQFCQSLISV